MITRPLSAYFSCHAFMCGSVRMQLMQLYVQKSINTTLPFRLCMLRGAEFIHSPAARSGALPDIGRFSMVWAGTLTNNVPIIMNAAITASTMNSGLIFFFEIHCHLLFRLQLFLPCRRRMPAEAEVCRAIRMLLYLQ